MILRFREDSQSFSGSFTAAGVKKRRMTVSGSHTADAEPVWTQAVSGDFFSVVGGPVALGRPVTLTDDRPASHNQF